MTQILTVQSEFIPALPPNNDTRYEVVDGQYVEMPPMSAYEVWVANILGLQLGAFAKSQNLGRAAIEMLFALDPTKKLQRCPDVAFVSYQRWPRERPVPHTSAWEVVPDLAVEVVSPTNFAEEVVMRVQEYFQAGSRQVWLIYPNLQRIYVYQSPTRVEILTRADQIDGDTVLPGFRTPVASLFEDDIPAG